MKRKRLDEDEDRSSGPTQSVQKYRDMLVLDENDLTRTTMEQQAIYFDIGQQRILAVSLRDELEYQKSQLYARLDAEVREDFSDEKKPTEPHIKSLISSKPDMVRLQRKLMNMEREVMEWQLMERSWDMRVSSVKVLTQQYASGYYAGPSFSVSDQKVREERRKRMPE